MRVFALILLLTGCSSTTSTTTTTTTTSTSTTSTSDADGDGVTSALDCDDADDTVGAAHDWFIDEDGDGYGVQSASTQFSCDGADGFVDNAADCDDSDAATHPDADEYCDGYDNNCDSLIDGEDSLDTVPYCLDADNDGFGDESDCALSCDAPPGYVGNSGDCDDADINVGAWGLYDDMHCGECFNECTDDTSCSDGVCTAACDYPTVDLSDGTYGNASTFNPYYLGVSMGGFLDDGVIHDGYIDGMESSSTMGFTFFDIDFNQVCTVEFDASNSSSTSFSTDDFGTMFEAWTITISNGVTDCQMLDSGIFGTASVHDFLSSIPWGVGIGPMGGDLGATLEKAVISSGLDWDADWAPYVSKMYVSVDAKTSYAVGYNFEYASTCENLTPDSSGEYTLKEVSTSGPLSSFTSSLFYYVFSLQ